MVNGKNQEIRFKSSLTIQIKLSKTHPHLPTKQGYHLAHKRRLLWSEGWKEWLAWILSLSILFLLLIADKLFSEIL